MQALRLAQLSLMAAFILTSAQVPGAAASVPAGPNGSAVIWEGSDRPQVSCSTPLRLYDGTNQTGTSVLVYTRGLWINLSDVGFNNRTSSYVVGACSVELAAGINGGGSHYPYCLYAGCVEDTMASGWNNVISSVYLH